LVCGDGYAVVHQPLRCGKCVLANLLHGNTIGEYTDVFEDYALASCQTFRHGGTIDWFYSYYLYI
jgi:hypothetical protein